MGRNKKYGNITLKQEDRELLEKLAKSQTAQYRKVQRAKILLMSADGMPNSEIATSIGVHRNTVATFVTKYIAAGLDFAMNDSVRTGKPSSISDEEKAWITNIACAKPKGNGLDAKDVLLPANSVANAPLPEISQYTTSIRLKNSEAQAFMAEMAVSGLMEEQPGGYELGLTVYDQGYSHVAPGLNQLARVSRLTLLLSAGAAGAAVLALALLHVLRMRREIAAMRSLGTKKGQIVVLSLAGILLVCLLGACAGAYAGHMVSAEVAGRVLAGAEEAAVDTTFTAMMGEETAKEFTFTLESDPKLAVAAGGAAVVAFTLLALLLLAAELRRPPMCLLAEKE